MLGRLHLQVWVLLPNVVNFRSYFNIQDSDIMSVFRALGRNNNSKWRILENDIVYDNNNNIRKEQVSKKSCNT